MERETRVFTYSHAEGLSKEEYGTFRDTFNRIAALNRQVLEKEKARENGGAEQSEQNAAVAEEAPQAESENVSDGIAAEPRYSADNPYAQWAADDDEVRRNADDWEQRKPLTETVLAKLNREAERQGFTVHIESRHASLGRFSAAREIQDGAYRVEIDGRFKNDGSMSSYEAPRDFTVSFHENGEITDYSK